MTRSHYSDLDASSMILRDHLAVDRTAMANERTLLAYVRTMIGVIAVGGTILKLFEGWFYLMIGVMFIILGVAILIIGFIRYTRILLVLRDIYQSDSRYENGDWMHRSLWGLLSRLHLATVSPQQSR